VQNATPLPQSSPYALHPNGWPSGRGVHPAVVGRRRRAPRRGPGRPDRAPHRRRDGRHLPAHRRDLVRRRPDAGPGA